MFLRFERDLSFQDNHQNPTENRHKERAYNMKTTCIKTLAGISIAGILGAQALAEQTIRPSGRHVNDLQVRGRVQTQFGYVDTSNDQGSGEYSTFEVRRARIGLRGTFDHNIRAQAEANVVPGSNFSVRAAFIQWREHKSAYVKVGFDKPLSSLEENTSSASILTVERSHVSNTIAAPGPTTGLSVSGDLGTFYYGAGLYTDQNNTNPANESAEYMFNGRVGVKLDGTLGEGSKLRIQGSVLTSDDSNGSLGFDDIYVLSLHLAQGNFDLRTEYMSGDNDGDKTSGFYIMPSLMLSSKLQGVVRYEMSESDKSTGIRAASRYVRRADNLGVVENETTGSKFDPQRGDEHFALYLGMNYYMNGDGSKLMFGLEFSELDNTAAGTLEATSVFGAWRALF